MFFCNWTPGSATELNHNVMRPDVYAYVYKYCVLAWNKQATTLHESDHRSKSSVCLKQPNKQTVREKKRDQSTQTKKKQLIPLLPKQ